MPPAGHVAVWILIYGFLVLSLLPVLFYVLGELLGIRLLSERQIYELWAIFATFSVLWVGLALAWRRFLFLKKDLTVLLERHGHRPSDGRIIIRGEMGSYYIDAHLDRPFRDYSPFVPHFRRRIGNNGSLKLESENPLNPSRMLRASRIDLYWLGELRELAGAEIRIALRTSRGPDVIIEHISGPEEMINPVRKAAGELKMPDSQLEVCVMKRWLRVRIVGGSWLGKAFGQRIEEGIAFTERLVDSLRRRFPPLDPNVYVLDKDLGVVTSSDRVRSAS